MTPDSVGPLSRPFSIAHLPARGTEVAVETTAAERDALARDLNLPAIRSLTARLHVQGSPVRVSVRGRIRASIVQTCVVTLDDFESELDEDVEVSFRAPRPGETDAQIGEEVEISDLDSPEELVGDRIDLGAITAEFLALGLDPYPRKPGVEFEPATGGDEKLETEGSPFAQLARLKGEAR